MTSPSQIADTRWFRAQFPGSFVESDFTETSEDLGELRQLRFVSSPDDSAAVFGIEVTELPTGMWDRMSTEQRQKAAPALARAFSDDFVVAKGGSAGAAGESNLDGERLSATGEQASRELCFVVATEKINGVVYLKTVVNNGVVVSSFVFTPPGGEGRKTAYGFIESVTLK